MANIVRIITKNGTNEVDLDNFNKEVVSFGRTSECDICLNEEYISRLHGCFYKENGAWFFKDLNSTYGIFFNGVKVDSGALNSNDMLVISGNNQQDIIQMVYIGNAMQPAINNAQGNTTNFCSSCGQRLEGNSLFCPYCGSKIEAESPVSNVMQAPAKKTKKQKQKGGKLGVVTFILGVVALLGFIALAILNTEFDVSVWVYMLYAAAFIAVVGVIFFCVSRKGKLAIVGLISSALTIVLVLGFVFILLPNKKKEISAFFMNEVKTCQNMDKTERNRSLEKVWGFGEGISTYPYESVNEFYSQEKDYQKDVERYLTSLYNIKDYETWIKACNYVDLSIMGGWGTYLYSDSDLLDELWNQSSDIDYASVEEYDVIYNNSEFADAPDPALGIRNELHRANKESWEKYSNDDEEIHVKFRKNGDILIAKTEYWGRPGYIVVNLINGDYFIGGIWN